MSKIEVGQFSSFLRRYLSMKGVSDVVDELAPEISPTFVLEAERPEWEFLKNQKLMSFSTTVTALAANPSSMQLRNPATSGVVCIVTFVAINHFGGISQNFLQINRASTADLTTVSGTRPRDTRQVVQGSSFIPSFGNVPPAGFSTVFAYRAAELATVSYDSPLVIAPGGAVAITTSNNMELMGTIHWMEKRIDELELS